MFSNTVKSFSLSSLMTTLILLAVAMTPISAQAQTGDLTVTIEPAEAVMAGAQWRRAGTTTWFDSGTTENGLTTGEVMIEFKRVMGWVTPVRQFVTIESEQTSIVSSSYVEAAGAIIGWGENYLGECDAPLPNSDFVAVEAGYEYSLGLKADGSLLAWGDNTSGQCDIPEPNTGFVAMSTAYHHSLGLKSDGTIVAWGDNMFGQCVVPEPNGDFIAISTGPTQSLALKSDGSIVAWGWNEYGQGSAPADNSGIVAISAGNTHNLALKSDGSIIAWGLNEYGECDVPGPNDHYIAVAAGYHFSLGLKSDGVIVAWGSNYNNECDVPEPNSGFLNIDAAAYHSLALKTNGSIVGWGDNIWDQFDVPIPNQSFMQFTAGIKHGLAIKQARTLTVNIEPVEAISDGAQWSIDDGTTWLDSGESLLLDPGDYTITYIPVWRWVEPTTQSITIANGDDISSTGTYVALQPGAITATIDPAQAAADGMKWRRVGTTTWLDSGASDSGLDAGDYEVEFKPTPGWTLPENQTVTVTWGNTTPVTASPVSLPPGSLTVTIGPAEAVAAGAQWRRVGTDTWLDSGVTETNVPVFEYMIEFKKIDQWQTPTFRMVSVESGQMASTSRDYFHGVGSLLIWGYDQGYGLLDAPEPNADFVQFDGGWYHSMALKADGTVVAWGDNTRGQCDVPEPNSDFVQVSAFSDRCAGLKSDGTVVVWGSAGIVDGTGYEPFDPPAAEDNHDFTEIAVGGYCNFGLRSDGSIFAWGDNQYNELDVPEPNSGFMAISAGTIHGLGLKSDGTIVAWGDNSYGQCDVPEPNGDFVAIATGAMHNVALKSDGTVVMWGVDNYGQCTLPSGNSNFVKISTSDFFSAGLKSDGSVVTFGTDHASISTVPEPNSGFLAVEANFRNIVGLKPTGVLTTTIEPTGAVAAGAQWSIDGGVTWRDSGASVPNPIGDYTVLFKRVPGYATPNSQTVTTNATTPAEITGTYTALAPGSLTVTIQPAEAAAAGAQWRRFGSDTWLDSGATESDIPVYDYMIEYKKTDLWITPNYQWISVETAAETTTVGAYRTGVGSLVSWGYSDLNISDVPSPNSNIVAISSGMFNLALKTDGSVLAWGGTNYSAELDVPDPNADFLAVSAGEDHALGLKSDGSIVAWGSNGYGKCDVPEPNSDYLAVSAGNDFSLGLKSDGSVVAWGDDLDYQCDVPAPNSGFLAISAGSNHGLGLKVDGSIVGWGHNDDGECDPPTPNNLFVAVSAGSGHSLGLKNDGSVVAWGNNDYGQCDVPEPNSGFIAIEASTGFSLGLKTDGTLVTWGSNFYGEADLPSPNADFLTMAGGVGHGFSLKPTGMISVTIEPSEAATAGAQWSIDGGSHWYDSGMTTPAPVGEHTVTYKDAFGYATPAADVVSLAADSPASVMGTYVVLPLASISVTIEPAGAIAAGAQWSIDSGSTWLDSGATTPDLVAGDYTVTFKDAFGYSTPADQTLSVTWGDSAIATGTYVALSLASLSVTIEPADAIAAGAQWSIDNGSTWRSSGATVSNLTAGDYTVTFKEATGYSKPIDQTITVTWADAATATGTYEAFPGSLSVTIEPADAVAAGAKWRIAGTQTWCDSAATTTGLTAGTTMIEFKPVMGWVKPLNQFATIVDTQNTTASGSYVECNGSVITWGSNTYGQCDVPSPNLDFVQVSSGNYHSAGLKSDGSIVMWGMNENGQCDVPEPNSDFIAVDAGTRHTLGLKSDGSIVAWGLNDAGQCNVPPPNSGFVAVAGGYKHSIGLKADGTIVEWGNHLSTNLIALTNNQGFVDIRAGYDHSLALRADGSIAAWGYNGYHECNIPAPNSGFVAIGVGVIDSFGLKANGSVVAWGYNTEGQCNVPTPNSGYQAVSGGCYHSIGLQTDGSVVGWGINNYNQLNLPTPNSGFVDMEAGYIHTVAIKPGVGVLTVGIEPAGALSAGAQWSIDGGTTWKNSATEVLLDPGEYTVDFKDVSGWITSASQAVTITAGQLTQATGTYTALPPGALTVTIEPAAVVTAGAQWSIDDGATWWDSEVTAADLAAGDYTVTFKEVFGWTTPSDQAVSVDWGETVTATGTYTVLPPGALTVTIEPAAVVTAGAKWSIDGGATWQDSSATASDLSAGEYTLIFKEISGWTTPASQTVTVTSGNSTAGSGTYVEIIPTSLSVTITPTEAVTAGAKWRRAGTYTWLDSGATEASLNTGTFMIEFKPVMGWVKPVNRFLTIVDSQETNASAAYVESKGSLVAWGDNRDGECNLPPSNIDYVQVSAGSANVLGLKADGSIVAWGMNTKGQCDLPEPNTDYVEVAAGHHHGLGLKVDGSIVAWGDNTYHQCDVPEPNSGFVAISAGEGHSLGLKADGTVIEWGNHYFGTYPTISPNTGFVAVAAGYDHSLALRPNGSIVAWGYNAFGQCNVPSPNSGFVAVEAGVYQSFGLKADGTLIAWGYNAQGQINVPSPNSGFIDASGGRYHSLGIKSNGSILAWGTNEYGQCVVPAPNSHFVAVDSGHSFSTGLKTGVGVLRAGIEPADAVTAGAQWSIDSGVTWHNSASELLLDSGTVTLQFKLLDGWFTPDTQSVTIETGQLADISVNYAHQPVDAAMVWVDFTYTGEEWGSEAQPYNTLAEGMMAVASGGTIRIKSGAAGSGMRITTPMRIEASGGPVVIGRSTITTNNVVNTNDSTGDSTNDGKLPGDFSDLLHQKNAVIEWVHYE